MSEGFVLLPRYPAALLPSAAPHNAMPHLPSRHFLFALLFPLVVHSFKYQIDERYAETAKWSYTETYMYGSGQGPLAWNNGVGVEGKGGGGR